MHYLRGLTKASCMTGMPVYLYLSVNSFAFLFLHKYARILVCIHTVYVRACAHSSKCHAQHRRLEVGTARHRPFPKGSRIESPSGKPLPSRAAGHDADHHVPPSRPSPRERDVPERPFRPVAAAATRNAAAATTEGGGGEGNRVPENATTSLAPHPPLARLQASHIEAKTLTGTNMNFFFPGQVLPT